MTSKDYKMDHISRFEDDTQLFLLQCSFMLRFLFEEKVAGMELRKNARKLLFANNNNLDKTG
uniref:Uncharacterized protein n=1 Tax=Arundo donax TaxID=35708 RepID=A0A0A9B4I1_ARUDO